MVQSPLFSSGVTGAALEEAPIGVAFFESASSRLVAANPEAKRLLERVIFTRDGLEEDQVPVQASVLRTDGQIYPGDKLPWVCTADNGTATQAQEIVLSHLTGEQFRCLVSTRCAKSELDEPLVVMVALLDISRVDHLQYTQAHVLMGALRELRTPLAAIKGSSAMVLGSRRLRTEAEYLEILKVIDVQADVLAEMLSTLADVSSLDSGNLVLRPEPVALEDILFEARGVFQRSGHTNAVRVEGIASVLWVNADRQRLVQLVAILLDQAADRSPVGSTLRILCKRGEDSHLRLEFHDLSVRSHSGQITAAHPSGGSATSDAPLGMLGLALAKGIVNAHGGEIWVERHEDQTRTTIVVTLPAIGPTVVVRAEGGAGGRAPRAFHSGTAAQVLAVGPDALTLRLLRRTLGEAGYRVHSNASVQEGLAVLDHENIDLLLFDASSEADGGSNALRMIRERSDIPLILIADRSVESGAVKALSGGADDFLAKPFAPEELVARAGAILRRTLTTQTVVTPPRFVLGGLSIDYSDHRVSIDGNIIELSAQQFRLLSVLSMNVGRIVSHTELLRAVWGASYEGETELLRSMVRNLRKRLNDNQAKPRYILSERGVGYRMPQS